MKNVSSDSFDKMKPKKKREYIQFRLSNCQSEETLKAILKSIKGVEYSITFQKLVDQAVKIISNQIENGEDSHCFPMQETSDEDLNKFFDKYSIFKDYTLSNFEDSGGDTSKPEEGDWWLWIWYSAVFKYYTIAQSVLAQRKDNPKLKVNQSHRAKSEESLDKTLKNQSAKTQEVNYIYGELTTKEETGNTDEEDKIYYILKLWLRELEDKKVGGPPQVEVSITEDSNMHQLLKDWWSSTPDPNQSFSSKVSLHVSKRLKTNITKKINALEGWSFNEDLKKKILSKDYGKLSFKMGIYCKRGLDLI